MQFEFHHWAVMSNEESSGDDVRAVNVLGILRYVLGRCDSGDSESRNVCASRVQSLNNKHTAVRISWLRKKALAPGYYDVKLR